MPGLFHGVKAAGAHC